MGKPCFLMLFTLLFFSCSQEDVSHFAGDTDLNGAWRLTGVACFCFVGDNIDFGDTALTFDAGRDMVTVAHSGKGTFFQEEGTHMYRGSGYRLLFTDGEAYKYELKENILKLIYVDDPMIADDEVVYTFKKV